MWCYTQRLERPVGPIKPCSQQTNWTELNWPAPSWPCYTTRYWSRTSASRSWLAAGLQCANCSPVQFSSSAVNTAWDGTYLQKESNVVELNSSPSGNSGQNWLHSSSLHVSATFTPSMQLSQSLYIHLYSSTHPSPKFRRVHPFLQGSRCVQQTDRQTANQHRHADARDQ